MNIELIKLDNFKDVGKKTIGSSGYDIASPMDVILSPSERRLIPCGFKLNIPIGFEVQIRPRSGLALKHGVTVLNTPGTIDSDYKGEIGVILINLSDTPYQLNCGDRIAQMVISQIPNLTINGENGEFIEYNDRNDGGFGSTGT